MSVNVPDIIYRELLENMDGVVEYWENSGCPECCKRDDDGSDCLYTQGKRLLQQLKELKLE